jgi:hypothetical protein
MSTAPVLDREEFIEQAYFCRVFRERLAENIPSQEILGQIHEEILTTTRLPMAIQFLATDLKHTGQLASGFARLTHYFTPFQAFVIAQAEEEGRRFPMSTALQVLEREALYKSEQPTPPGLFMYQFESICRNRMGYGDGLTAMTKDALYDEAWKAYIATVRRQIGVIDFPDMVYLRSELYVIDQRRNQPDYEVPVAPLFGQKEGRIAKASRGRDPLYLFAALQRQLGYPEVPRPKPADTSAPKLESFIVKVRELEARIKLLEGEVRGNIDLTELAKPDLLKGLEDEV